MPSFAKIAQKSAAPEAENFRHYSRHRALSALLCVSVVLSLPACSTLPVRLNAPVHTVQDIDTSNTALAQTFDPLKAQHPHLTGYYLLYDPLAALAARLQLINEAEKTLDLQYYIWNNDKIGALALHALLKAADRGVRVRLLIDDNNSSSIEASLLALSEHPNIEVRLFNPYRFRKHRGLDILLDGKRINRRMHNKSFIADHQVALIGGRNMSNQYYNASDNFQFSDIDALLVGPAADEISLSFDDYWNNEFAYPIGQVVKPTQPQLSYSMLKHQLEDHFQQITVQNYLNLATHSKAFTEWLKSDVQLEWVPAEILKDSPEKIRTSANKEEHSSFQLLHYLQASQQSIDIVSAYFVPEKQGAKTLGQLAQQGVNVRVLTNSFKANDVAVVHAFYAKYREDLLKHGVQLYEFLPAIPPEQLDKTSKEIAKKAKISLRGLSHSSLHAKLMALDDRQVFIGSFNFDPRSAYSNTEIGVLLNSPNLAKAINRHMDFSLPKYAYMLQLNPQGQIQWQQQTPQGPVIFNQEPHMNWWQKVVMKVVSWLPVEKLM